jgi:hypothetical protein
MRRGSPERTAAKSLQRKAFGPDQLVLRGFFAVRIRAITERDETALEQGL